METPKLFEKNNQTISTYAVFEKQNMDQGFEEPKHLYEKLEGMEDVMSSILKDLRKNRDDLVECSQTFDSYDGFIREFNYNSQNLIVESLSDLDNKVSKHITQSSKNLSDLKREMGSFFGDIDVMVKELESASRRVLQAEQKVGI